MPPLPPASTVGAAAALLLLLLLFRLIYLLFKPRPFPAKRSGKLKTLVVLGSGALNVTSSSSSSFTYAHK